MTSSSIFSMVGLFFAVTALAQQPNPYNGTWRIEFDSKKGVAREGSVILNDEGGTWQILSHKKKDACAGREFSISIQRATEDELVFAINASKTLTGCKDDVATLKRTGDKTLEGTTDDGRKIKLVRQ